MNGENPDFTATQMLLKGVMVALLALAPSLSVFAIAWGILDDLLLASAIGAVTHLASMVFAYKISKKLFARGR